MIEEFANLQKEKKQMEVKSTQLETKNVQLETKLEKEQRENERLLDLLKQKGIDPDHHE